MIDKLTGKIYYQNSKEFRTQWEKPLKQVIPDGLKLSKSEVDFIETITGAEFRKVESVLFENGECVVCYESLYENGPTVLTEKGKRVCRHFICNVCALVLVEGKDFNCPLCRTKFSGIKVLPDIRVDPQGWYLTCNLDEEGFLRREELEDALTSILPIQHAQIIADLELL